MGRCELIQLKKIHNRFEEKRGGGRKGGSHSNLTCPNATQIGI